MYIFGNAIFYYNKGHIHISKKGKKDFCEINQSERNIRGKM